MSDMVDEAKLEEIARKATPPKVGPCAVCGGHVDSDIEDLFYGRRVFSVDENGVALVHERCVPRDALRTGT